MNSEKVSYQLQAALGSSQSLMDSIMDAVNNIASSFTGTSNVNHGVFFKGMLLAPCFCPGALSWKCSAFLLPCPLVEKQYATK